ncbi:hypothetical protein GOBAR_AA12665 [Gossypium barbadense]|uniref:Uncharacterized protein n=1 Tax=Gossypium barbadense TaxID=3634 RepID=A0A2P5XXB9_GOSBA|nr:hypothetical protein GOBAR_AA12665 [Gossypium barbadense]
MVEEAVVISLGLIGAGTNNARIVGMLRNLLSFYYKVRITQGLVHIGKGLLTLNPYHSDRLLCSSPGWLTQNYHWFSDPFNLCPSGYCERAELATENEQLVSIPCSRIVE